MEVLEIIDCDLKRERGRNLKIYRSGDRTVGSYKNKNKKQKTHKQASIQTQLLKCSITYERGDAETSYWRNFLFF